MGLTSMKVLKNMPNSEVFPIEGAGHPAYIDKPNEWHRILYNYLRQVESHKD